MVQGTNKTGEVSAYTFNGLGVRVGTELILEDNSHGYTDFHCQMPSVETGIEKPEVVKTDYVIDYTHLDTDQRVLVKSEQDGYDFRYTYGLDKVKVYTTSEGSDWWGQNIHKCVNADYVHVDRLGSVVNLSDQYGRVTARADYTDWGEVRKYTDITVDQGFRRLLPEITYATHEYDDVLNQFYAKARMYDAENKRFDAVDPILDPVGYSISSYVTDPMMLVQYLYVKDRPLVYVDEDGEVFALVTGAIGAAVGAATAGYKQYKRTGKVSLKTVAKGAAVGAAVGAGAGLLAGVVSGAGALAATAKVAATIIGKAVATAAAAATIRNSHALAKKVGAGQKIRPKDVVKATVNTGVSVVSTGVPAVGTVVAAANAYKSGKSTVTAAKKGDYLGAAVSAGETLLNIATAYSGFKEVYCSRGIGGTSRTGTSGTFTENTQTSLTTSQQQSVPSSKTLRKNLINAGENVPDYANAAHHIVAGSAKKASVARNILQKFGVDINDANNGVFLPTSNNVSTAANHRGLHTNAYYEKVNTLLLSATSREDVLDILNDIKDDLINGTF